MVKNTTIHSDIETMAQHDLNLVNGKGCAEAFLPLR